MGTEREPTRAEIDALPGRVVLEFGASWCGHCQALRPHIDRELARHPTIQHIRLEDAKGKRLGRSFRVKLWPTLVFLLDGQVIAQAVRPRPAEVRQDMQALADMAIPDAPGSSAASD